MEKGLIPFKNGYPESPPPFRTLLKRPNTRLIRMQSVPQNCRARLQPRDFDFIAKVLSGSGVSEFEALIRLLSDEKSLNSLLESPKLLEALLHLKQPIQVSPELYFYVLVRHALRQAGIDHLEATDYVAATLVDHASGVRSHRGDLPMDDVPYHVDFIEALNGATAYDQFYLHVRCGNQFLVLTGLFPKFIARREERRGAPGVRYYEGVARESFRTAGEHPLANEFDLSEVYQLLAEELPTARRALNRMAQEYLFLGA